jgi:hypothetical protein
MLRAAIETDAATLKDLATSEDMFRAGAGEVIEVFQLRGDDEQSLVRVPPYAAPIAPPDGRTTRVDTDGSRISVVARAPINAPGGGVRGAVVIASAVDLGVIQHYLAPHATRARITGLAKEVPLVAGSGAGDEPEVSVAIVASTLGSAAAAGSAAAPAPLNLVATPVVTSGVVAWLDPVRYAALGLAALLLIVYTIGLSRSRKRP